MSTKHQPVWWLYDRNKENWVTVPLLSIRGYQSIFCLEAAPVSCFTVWHSNTNAGTAPHFENKMYLLFFFFFLMLGHFRFHSLKICHSAFLLLFGKATTCKVFVARSIVQQRGIQEWSEVIEGDKVFEKNSLSLSFRNSVFPVLEVIYMENLEV